MRSLTSIFLTVPRFLNYIPLPALHAIFLSIFVFLFKSTNNLIEGITAKIVRAKGYILFRSLNPWANFLVCIIRSNGRLEVLNVGPERINGSTLLAFGLVFVIFTAA
jgi:hypothetical protein